MSGGARVGWRARAGGESARRASGKGEGADRRPARALAAHTQKQGLRTRARAAAHAARCAQPATQHARAALTRLTRAAHDAAWRCTQARAALRQHSFTHSRVSDGGLFAQPAWRLPCGGRRAPDLPATGAGDAMVARTAPARPAWALRGVRRAWVRRYVRLRSSRKPRPGLDPRSMLPASRCLLPVRVPRAWLPQRKRLAGGQRLRPVGVAATQRLVRAWPRRE